MVADAVARTVAVPSSTMLARVVAMRYREDRRGEGGLKRLRDRPFKPGLCRLRLGRYAFMRAG